VFGSRTGAQERVLTNDCSSHATSGDQDSACEGADK
jgi:hypothetical protein